MSLFCFPRYEYIAERLRTLPPFDRAHFSIERYNNQELHAAVSGSISGRPCAILGSISPPDEQIASFTLLAHTLKKEGAGRILGILPYLAYMREDKPKPGESLSVSWAGVLLKASGVDRVLTVDLHSERDKELFPIPLISLSPANLFAAAICHSGWIDATIVAPDNGAIARCEAVKSALGVAPAATPYFEKRRTPDGVIHGRLFGNVGARVILVDDILDTGGTLVSACEKLREANVREISIFVTHGLFTGSHWKRLWSLGVSRVFCTDTIPACAALAEPDITVLPIAPLLEENLPSKF